MSPNAGGLGGGGEICGVSANEYSCAYGAQINFVDLTSYINYMVLNVAHFFGRIYRTHYGTVLGFTLPAINPAQIAPHGEVTNYYFEIKTELAW